MGQGAPRILHILPSTLHTLFLLSFTILPISSTALLGGVAGENLAHAYVAKSGRSPSANRRPATHAEDRPRSHVHAMQYSYFPSRQESEVLANAKTGFSQAKKQRLRKTFDELTSIQGFETFNSGLP